MGPSSHGPPAGAPALAGELLWLGPVITYRGSMETMRVRSVARSSDRSPRRSGGHRCARERSGWTRRGVSWAWALFVVVGIASCAPVAAPARTVAIDGAPPEVRAGEAVRAVVTLGYGEFGLQPGDLDPLPLPEILFAPREDVTWAFVVRGTDVPQGWTVRLDDVVRVVESLDEGGRSFSLEVSLRIGVPPAAGPGVYRTAALVRAPGAGQRWVDVVVRVPRP